ncbi:MAG: OmpA family protein [Gammaproteobacteria bacterium]|nr:OmpA family protein [Gammaproteobacteria bacterium]MDH5651406.1 OmpA family protein [Gammaproteobacteria bacterium]
MKRYLIPSLLLAAVVLWPTGMVISGPPRSWERTSGDIPVSGWPENPQQQEAMQTHSIAESTEPGQIELMAKVGALKSRLNADRERQLKGEQARAEQDELTRAETSEKKQTTPVSDPGAVEDKTLKQLKQENSNDEVTDTEWVGKDRRLQRTRKIEGVGGQQLYKPPNRLIVTDQYHKSIPELLGTADLRSYGAEPTEAAWNNSSSKFLCEIRHPIPGFGFAVFKREIGMGIQFAIESFHTTGGSGPARVQSVPPAWKHYASIKDLGLVPVKPQGKVLFTVAADWAGRLMLELQEGMEATFAFWDDQTGGEDVLIKVSPFNFKKTLPEFNRCMGDMLPYSFGDVRHTTILFGYDKTGLADRYHERLNKVIEYLKLDETVKYVDITGFSDSRGFKNYNKLLATRRANAVKKYLVKQGIDRERIRVKSLGEKGKKFSNRTEAGRRKNRRVEVTLVK